MNKRQQLIARLVEEALSNRVTILAIGQYIVDEAAIEGFDLSGVQGTIEAVCYAHLSYLKRELA